MSERISVREETYDALCESKREDETFDELISRLIEMRYGLVREGAGLWEGTDAAEKARDARREMKEYGGNS